MSDSGCDGRRWRCGPLRGRHRELRLIFGRQLIPMRLRNRRVVTVLDDVRPHGLGVGLISEALVVDGPTEWHDAPLVFRFRIANAEPLIHDGRVRPSARERWRGMVFLPRVCCR